MLFIFALAAVNAQTAVLNIIPRPNVIQPALGRFTLNRETRIVTSPETEADGYLLRDELHPGTGLPLEVTRHGSGNVIELRIDGHLARLGSEGYVIDAKPDRVEIRSSTPAGVFYGMQSLRQMLPSRTFRTSVTGSDVLAVPCCHIEDRPRFQWRGAMLDVSRHFEPKAFLLKFIDLLALHKMNVFHLHLTDNQGWRIEIKKYPLLTQIGGWHKPNKLSDDPTTYNSMMDGGFYTQEDLREVVAFAKARNVTVVPEIEMPGHSAAAIAAYPELGNQVTHSVVPGVNEGAPDVLSASTKTLRFYQDILTEVMDIFPSTFIHVGGDEVGKDPWRKNPEMQAQIKTLGLKNEDELQSWFIGQMDRFLTEHHRRLVGWDEILEGGLAQGATVMSWRGIEGGIAAAKANHDVVMAPGDPTYLDHYQARDHAHEPVAIGGFLPLDRVYAYEPIPDALTAEQAKHVLGGQCQLWTEYMPNAAHVEYMAYPRICAMAEVDWSAKDQRNFDDFISRLKPHLDRLHALDVNYRPLDGPVAGPVGWWKSGEMTEKYTVHTWNVGNHIRRPGTYQAIFSYTEGGCRLDIEWAELTDGHEVVARDAHYGRTGGDEADNVYTFLVKTVKPDANYMLRASVRTDGGVDSNGEIRVVRQ